MSQEGETKHLTPNQAAMRMLASFLLTLLLSGVLLFGGAGLARLAARRRRASS